MDVFVGRRRDTGEAVEFPVDWPSPEDAERAWRWDAEHFPFPLTPLSHDFGPFADGTMPVRPLEANGYSYWPVDRQTWAPPGSVESSRDVIELWEGTWQPELEAAARALWSQDYDSMPLAQLVELVNRLPSERVKGLHYNLQAGMAVGQSLQQLTQFLSSRVGANAQSMAAEMTQAVDNISLEKAGTLWEIAQRAKQSIDLVELLRSGEVTEGSLTSMPSGKVFLTEFGDWLDRYGLTNGRWLELDEPTWIEDWAIPLTMVVRYLDASDPRAEQSALAARRLQLTRELRALLSTDEERAEFDRLAEEVLHYIPIREARPVTGNMALCSMRKPLLAIGRKLAASQLIPAPDDVFYLRRSELDLAAKEALHPVDTLLKDRRAEYEYWCNVVPPIEIGPGARQSDAGSQAIDGIAASTGRAEAIARVILVLEDASRLQAGEIW